MARGIVFVCEHGAAKSVVAAAHFNRLAHDAGLTVRAVARGTHPDAALTAEAVAGLASDGLNPVDDAPALLTDGDVTRARRVIVFGAVPPAVATSPSEVWTHVPAVSADYARARDAMLPDLERLVRELAGPEEG